MTPYAHAMAKALLDPAAPSPAGLRAWNGSDTAVRFDVYRNNVTSSLVAALADTFPVVRELVGCEFFSAMAREFVRRHAPTSPILAQYGAGFSAYVADFEPAASVPYLADMARLEYARVQAWHAADAVALAPDLIATKLADAQALPQARLRLQPALAVIESPFAIVALWGAHQGHGDIGEVEPAAPEAALVLREDDDVVLLGVPHAHARFIAQLAAGQTLGAAAMAGAQHTGPDGLAFELSTAMGLLLARGAITDWHTP